MKGLRRLTERARRPADDRPYFDPWHGTNPAFLYELRVIRRALRLRSQGRLRRLVRFVGKVLLLILAAVGLYALARWVITSPDPRFTLAGTALVLYGFLWLVQQWQLFGTFGTLTANYAASAVTRERERSTWELLTITGLGSQRIVLGKYLAALEAMPNIPILIGLYITLELVALMVVIALQDAILPPPGQLPAGTWLVLVVGTLIGSVQLVTAYASGAAAAVAVSSWLRSSGVSIGVSNAVTVVTHYVVPALAAFLILLRAFIEWPLGRAESAPYALIFTYPAGMTVAYGLVTVVFLRLAIWGVDRRP